MAVQFIRSARPGKPVVWYVYAFKGGPLILKHAGPRKPKLGAAEHAKIADAIAATRAVNPDTMRAALRQWCPVDPAKDADAAPEWRDLSANTKRVWRPHVDLIEVRWGKFPMAVWDDPRMIAKVVKWRDERAHIPRTADIGVTVLNHFLDFARLRGLVRINAAADVPTLYRGSDRAEIIWTAEDMTAFEAKARGMKRPALIDGLRLAAVTGLRREDLITLTWSQLGEFAIVKRALKASRGKRRRAIIPRTPQLESVLDELRTRPRQPGVDTVLVTSHGRPWSVNGFGVSFSTVKGAAGIVHTDDDGKQRPKHLHDVRGTFCTMLLTEWELTDQEAADVMGWSPERVAHIRKVYVDHKRVVVALGQRIAERQEQNMIAKQSGGA